MFAHGDVRHILNFDDGRLLRLLSQVVDEGLLLLGMVHTLLSNLKVFIVNEFPLLDRALQVNRVVIGCGPLVVLTLPPLFGLIDDVLAQLLQALPVINSLSIERLNTHLIRWVNGK